MSFPILKSNVQDLVDLSAIRKPNGKGGERWPEVFMQTFMRKVMRPLRVYSFEVCIEDIAHSLSQQCRYTGHTEPFYSVATHSLIVASLLPDKCKLEGLLHDASECYLGDFHGPLKSQMYAYMQAEDIACKAIAGRFNLVYPWPEEVVRADHYTFQLECAFTMGGALGRQWGVEDNGPLRRLVEEQIHIAAAEGMEYVEASFLEAFQEMKRNW